MLDGCVSWTGMSAANGTALWWVQSGNMSPDLMSLTQDHREVDLCLKTVTLLCLVAF